MNKVLARWNQLSFADAVREIVPCCGSMSWAQGLAGRRPMTTEALLLISSNEIWRNLSLSAWLEAFDSHPRIGESPSKAPAVAQSACWSQQEQSNVSSADDATRADLAAANRAYEKKFGRTFIVCATGKSAAEILAILHRRMQNDTNAELQEAAEEQRQITQLRLQKWLGI
jgi:2-oxo-4-hydroxy-4-carboxy-5-ureidoimidazoline decarboxylase